MPLASNAFSRVSRRQLTPPPRTAPRWMPPAVRRLRHVLPVTGSSAPGAALSWGQASFAIRITQIWWLSPFSLFSTQTVGHVGQPAARKNAAADGTLVDAARGQALASRSSCHRVFRSRGRVSHGQASFAKVDHSFIKASPDLVAVTFFTRLRSQSGPDNQDQRSQPPIRWGSDSFSLRSRRRPPRGSDAASADATLRTPHRLRRPTPSAWARGHPRF
jgi:hypothetical protein